MTNGRRDGAAAVALGSAILLQGFGLAIFGRLTGTTALQVVLIAAALAVAAAMTWRVRMRLNHRVDMLLVMAAYGGLGMMVGSRVDALTAPASHHGHAAATAPWAMVPTWMTGLMLAAAIPAALLLTRCAALARTGWRRWVSTHVVGNLFMVVGMVWVGAWLGPALGALAGSHRVGHHTAMVIGMLLGMELGMFAGEAALGLAPWREWRWREDWESTLTAARGAKG